MSTRHSDPDTSHKADDSIKPMLNRLQRRVLGYAQERGDKGFDDLQLRAKFSGSGSTYRTRRAELRDRGYIYDTGRRVQSNPKSSREYAVWAITPKGARVQL